MRARGQAMLIAMLLLILLGGLGAVAATRCVHETQLIRRHVGASRAFWAAEAGLQRAFWDIVNNDCRSMKEAGTEVLCEACNRCGDGNRVLAGGLAGGAYLVVVHKDDPHIISTGSSGSGAGMPPYQRRIEVELGVAPLFGYGAFSKDSIILRNNVLIDSYDSRQGDYGGQNVGTQGNIATNSAATDAVTVGSDSEVKGSVVKEAGIGMDPVVVPDVLQASPSLGTLALFNSQAKVLSGGDYKYSKIVMADNSALSVTGDVSIYLTDSPAISSGTNNQVVINDGASLKIYIEGAVALTPDLVLKNLSGKPQNFIIYSRYAGANGVVISGGTDFKGAVYAPDTDIVVGPKTSVFGALAGKTVTVSAKAKIHFDQSLSKVANPTSAASLHNWQEKPL